MAATLKVHKWYAQSVYVRLLKGLYAPLSWGKGLLTLLKSIAEVRVKYVPDQQVTEIGQSSIFWLLLLPSTGITMGPYLCQKSVTLTILYVELRTCMHLHIWSHIIVYISHSWNFQPTFIYTCTFIDVTPHLYTTYICDSVALIDVKLICHINHN